MNSPKRVIGSNVRDDRLSVAGSRAYGYHMRERINWVPNRIAVRCTLILAVVSNLVLASSAEALNNDAASVQSKSVDDKQIEKANALHAQATRFVERQDIEAATAKEKEAEALAPGYWLPHAALGYLYFGRGGPAIQEAERSIKTPHPSFVDTNLAQMLQYFCMYDDALKAFQRVPENDPQFPIAKVGIAACLMHMNKMEDGRKLLDEVYASSPKDPRLLEALARTYFEIAEMQRTVELSRAALASSPDQTATERLKKLMLVAAVNASDASTTNSLKDSVRTHMEPYEVGWLRAAEFTFANTAKEALTILRFAETENTSNIQWLSYACVLQKRANTAFDGDKTGWMQIENACLEKCGTAEPNNVDIRIMQAALAERLGEKRLALSKVQEGWSSAPVGLDANAIHANDKQSRSDVTTLAKSFVKEGTSYRSYVSMIKCKLLKVTCHCRYDRFKEAVLAVPGVIDVVIGPGDSPTALVLFDAHKASKKTIFLNIGVVNLKENMEISEVQPVKTITELGDLAVEFVPPLHEPAFFMNRIALQFPPPDSGSQKSTTQLTRL
ncbi:MAG TPA: tetratricopeptide repeat protein [Trichormus sp.]